MTPEREEKFKRVVDHRQFDWTVILEDVHDRHNISAVLRTCDSVGIREIFVLYTDTAPEKLELGKKSSGSAKKWVEVHFFTDRATCFKAVKAKYDHIYCTHLDEEAKSLYDLNLSHSVALLFGNERDGVSPESLAYCDGNFIIPQQGMVESLNISVACAISLYEGYRQRSRKELYPNPKVNQGIKDALFNFYKSKTPGDQY